MLPFVIGLLTFFLVLDCFVLVFLVLIQLPKKEAGAGLAFGGSATDALFGAGSGNVLTKVTKYAAGIFFALAILLSVLQKKPHGNPALSGAGMAPRPAPVEQPPGSTPAPSGQSALPPAPVQSSNAIVPSVENTNVLTAPPAPAPAGTNK